MKQTNYIIRSRVAWVQGEWVRFEGSQERMKLGENHFHVGDEVLITITHVVDPKAPSNANP